MAYLLEDLDNPSEFRQILAISYSDLIGFILKYLKEISGLIFFFWIACILSAGLAICERLYISHQFPFINIFTHSIMGFVLFPILSIPIHEGLHVIPYYFSGARNIRIGMDIKQYIFYVTAHRYVASPSQFIIVAMVPFTLISIALIIQIMVLPGLWKWSLSVFLFVHTTMCAGDFALMNFYFINKPKEIYTWDDADQKMAYFYEKLEKNDGVKK